MLKRPSNRATQRDSSPNHVMHEGRRSAANFIDEVVGPTMHDPPLERPSEPGLLRDASMVRRHEMGAEPTTWIAVELGPLRSRKGGTQLNYTELLTSGANVTSWEIVVRLVLAALFAAVVGWERERSGRAAGLRTHMMVSLGATGFAVIALDMESILPPAAEVTMSADPVRIIAAIVGGVGFLGAGAIIQSRGEVRGLTTAASL